MLRSQAMTEVLLVGLGGFLGSVLRYLLGGLAHRLAPFTTYPVGTLAVNLVGCLVLGWLGGLADARQLFGQEVRLFVFIGVLGGFTTFSTFGYETLVMLRDGDAGRAVVNILAHVVVGIGAAWFGYGLGSTR